VAQRSPHRLTERCTSRGGHPGSPIYSIISVVSIVCREPVPAGLLATRSGAGPALPMYVAAVGEMLRDGGDARRVSSASAVIGLSWSLEREGVDLGWAPLRCQGSDPKHRNSCRTPGENSRPKLMARTLGTYSWPKLLAQTVGPNCWPKLLAESMPKRRSAPGNAQGGMLRGNAQGNAPGNAWGNCGEPWFGLLRSGSRVPAVTRHF